MTFAHLHWFLDTITNCQDDGRYEINSERFIFPFWVRVNWELPILFLSLSFLFIVIKDCKCSVLSISMFHVCVCLGTYLWFLWTSCTYLSFMVIKVGGFFHFKRKESVANYDCLVISQTDFAQLFLCVWGWPWQILESCYFLRDLLCKQDFSQ